ncbi:hypothetical protein CSV72_06270 [Sporosarcina sp. P20a]|uniref:hypothetical protein n=1 Tax=Sporosarcina sp. P20a TaxID=2048256 RepID=UPI000C172EA0|nr:hypothetical protein [Sporosarcina sp. P20a]PIC86978.1 hypothetical protein CSV72_06270 [Sporosarcina sp. P20a]
MIIIYKSFEEVSSLVHDIVYHSRLPNNTDRYTFQICKGKLHVEEQQFILDSGLVIRVRYEETDELYYKVT